MGVCNEYVMMSKILVLLIFLEVSQQTKGSRHFVDPTRYIPNACNIEKAQIRTKLIVPKSFKRQLTVKKAAFDREYQADKRFRKSQVNCVDQKWIKLRSEEKLEQISVGKSERNKN